VLASARVPSARLETVFRQAARSQIVTNAHRIRQGLLPELAPPQALALAFGSLPGQAIGPRGGRSTPEDRVVRGSTALTGSDCVFVTAPAARVAAVAAEWAAVRLPRLLGVPTVEVQAIAPLVRVCQTLNSLLQERLNPARGQPERAHGALPLRVGDRVIQTHNNYHLGVFNGDTGTVVEIDGAARLIVDFGDGRVVEYGAADVLDLDHAYGLTVHRAQGSEWPGVVVLASSSFGPILSRNLLYTALTRARRAAVVVGDEAAIAEAVARTRDQERVTGLPVLLRAGATGGESGGGAVAEPGRRPSPPRPPAPASRRGGSPGVTSPPAVPEGPVWDPEVDEESLDDLAELSTAPLSEEPFQPMPDDWPDDDAW
jgi:exodeoxyribonuclease V alpha subunit